MSVKHYQEAAAALFVQNLRARADDRAVDFETSAIASDVEVGVLCVQVKRADTIHDGVHAGHVLFPRRFGAACRKGCFSLGSYMQGFDALADNSCDFGA